MELAYKSFMENISSFTTISVRRFWQDIFFGFKSLSNTAATARMFQTNLILRYVSAYMALNDVFEFVNNSCYQNTEQNFKRTSRLTDAYNTYTYLPDELYVLSYIPRFCL